MEDAIRVICDKRMPTGLKVKCYETIILSAMLYVTEFLATTRKHVHNMLVIARQL